MSELIESQLYMPSGKIIFSQIFDNIDEYPKTKFPLYSQHNLISVLYEDGLFKGLMTNIVEECLLKKDIINSEYEYVYVKTISVNTGGFVLIDGESQERKHIYDKFITKYWSKEKKIDVTGSNFGFVIPVPNGDYDLYGIFYNDKLVSVKINFD
jgi:hypothetical protein